MSRLPMIFSVVYLSVAVVLFGGVCVCLHQTARPPPPRRWWLLAWIPALSLGLISLLHSRLGDDEAIYLNGVAVYVITLADATMHLVAVAGMSLPPRGRDLYVVCMTAAMASSLLALVIVRHEKVPRSLALFVPASGLTTFELAAFAHAAHQRIREHRRFQCGLRVTIPSLAWCSVRLIPLACLWLWTGFGIHNARVCMVNQQLQVLLCLGHCLARSVRVWRNERELRDVEVRRGEAARQKGLRREAQACFSLGDGRAMVLPPDHPTSRFSWG